MVNERRNHRRRRNGPRRLEPQPLAAHSAAADPAARVAGAAAADDAVPVARRPSVDLAAVIGDVAMRILGTPNQDLTTRDELRFSSKGALAVTVAGQYRGTWVDFSKEEGTPERGGGVLDFVMFHGGVGSKRDAWKWLEDEGFVSKSDSPATRNVYGLWEDEDGKVLSRERREEYVANGKRKKSDFGVPDGKGGFASFRGCMKDVRRVLYRLPAICRLELGSLVFVPEGFRKVELLSGPGWRLEATCNPFGGGASKSKKLKWPDEFTESLKGMRVVLLADKDPTGTGHANALAAKLSGIAASVKVIVLPGLSEKEDVVEWAKYGGTREELLALVEAQPEWVPTGAEGLASWDACITLNDFYAFLPKHTYIYAPTRDMWAEESIKSTISRAAVRWLDNNRAVHQMIWAPSEDMIIKDRLMFEGGWIEKEGVRSFNLYRPPTIEPGDARKAGPWLKHVKRLYPVHGRRFVMWLAYKVQFPGAKINHGVVMGGKQGIGKDSILEPIKHAVGPWNFRETSPTKVFDRFNPFQQGVIIRISEARDMGDANVARVDRYAFYEHTKTLMAAPPDTLQVNDKYVKEYSIVNCCGVIFTTNHKDGLYLPPDDRRTFVMWSNIEPWDPKAAREGKDQPNSLSPKYFVGLWDWFEDGGCEHVTAYLKSLDLSKFDPKASPPNTEAFWDMVNASLSSDNAEFDDAIDRMGRPLALTIYNIICNEAGSDLARLLEDRKSRKAVKHRMEDCGYVALRNPDSKQGLWTINGKKQVVYVRAELSDRDRFKATTDLMNRAPF